ncbi:MAG: glycan-binding surface protein [Bacteroidales bacterium]|jgi:hypothetical protein|nr:glycan-binding surface protein [Bacteroidales bacterium]MCI2122304.1 glycan-binding surface protein [Bacteroidales bacterium]MCI2145151.1 glycan-binding surface protein [Bacteroidales bacterium]
MKYTKYFIIAAVSLLAFASCSIFETDPTENTAVPVIKYVRPTVAAASDSLLSEASMGATVAIIGENLSGVDEVWFNDREAKLNPVYVTNTSIVCQVPGSMPSEITNTITAKTKAGKSCTYGFSVIIPSPKVTSIDCEWAADGSTVTITGNYFFGDASEVKVLFPGNVYAEVTDVSTTSITCVVPEGALAGTIFVTSLYGKGRSEFTFRDSGVWFLDFENTSTWNTWSYSDFETEGGISGSYMNFVGTGGSWAWPNSNLCFYYHNPTQTCLVDGGDVADYALAFEYECDYWSDTPFCLIFTATDNSFDVDSDNAQWHWEPYVNDGVYSTFTTNGEWKTMIVPLTDFNTSKDESETRKIKSVNELVNINGIFFGAAESDTDKAISLKIDDLRIIKL